MEYDMTGKYYIGYTSDEHINGVENFINDIQKE